MVTAARIPRLLIAAPASGGGKTTVATGLMAALHGAGLDVAPFKVGPDYIDPGFHAVAAGRVGRNLDAVLCGDELIAPLLLHGARTPTPCDVAVIEGVMGLFDGQLSSGGRGSSAHVARLTGTPVVLVIDCSRASRTHAAVAAGLAAFDPATPVAGVILNKVASTRHGAEVASELDRLGIPVFGSLPRQAAISLPERHLGLVPAGELAEAGRQVEAVGRFVAEHVDVEALLAVARSAADLDVRAWDPAGYVERVAGSPRIAVAGGRAFTFSYPETTELLEAAGCEIAVFDPLRDPDLPSGTAGLVVGGGFPEVHAAQLAANASLLRAVRRFAAAGGPVVAECAGLLWLSSGLEGHAMAGVIPATAAMGPRLRMGYREAVAPHDTLLARAGERCTGHEYHRTALTPLAGADLTPAWRIPMPDGSVTDDGASLALGGGPPNVHAGYLHLHWAAIPRAAQRLADAASRFVPPAGHPAAAPDDPPVVEPDLAHHGDRDVSDGMVDFAVNVAVPRPPAWLAGRIVGGAERWAAYPDAAPARAALAGRHGLDEAQVLPTAGAAEAFALVARALAPKHPVVVHPQFTEPEAALRAAGHTVDRLVLGPDDGFRLNPHALPRDADLVVLGNPTNPTGALHPRAAIEELRRPGRVIVVDEAFMDLTDESQSLVTAGLDGVLVLRSLTKTFGLAGLRVGYVAGDPELVAALARQQTPWSVSTPAIDAILACCTPEADRHAAGLRESLPRRRADLAARLRALGLRVMPSQAPFVLVDTAGIDPRGSVRAALAERGIAVRRGETFPGLGPTWIRVAVRDDDRHEQLTSALADLITDRSPH